MLNSGVWDILENLERNQVRSELNLPGSLTYLECFKKEVRERSDDHTLCTGLCISYNACLILSGRIPRRVYSQGRSIAVILRSTKFSRIENRVLTSGQTRTAYLQKIWRQIMRERAQKDRGEAYENGS
jgi:hypothetical protein